MKQKVVIRATVSRKGRVLLLRRHGGRPSIAGLYELPGGGLHRGEQPTDALKRSLQIHAGVEPENFRLGDVVSFIDPEDRELQYVFILFHAEIGADQRITLDDEYDHYLWRKLSEIQQAQITNSTKILLNLGANNSREHADFVLDSDKNVANLTTLTIFSDGGSRGNPGPSAAAFIIMDKNENIVAQGGKFLGRGDSGMAEYVGVELALAKAAELGAQVVEFFSDSLMVVNQLNGLFSVKNGEFREIHDRIMKLFVNFRRITFRHIHREFNRMADGLVNKILDENE